MASTVSIGDQIQEVDRELGLRRKVYPRWTTGPNPKLTKAMAELHLGRLEAVRASLEDLQALAVAMAGVVSRHSDGPAYALRFRSEAEQKALAAAIDRILLPVEFPIDGKPVTA